MSEQLENTSADLEADDMQDDYEGDLGDGAKKRGSGAGIIGLGSGE